MWEGFRNRSIFAGRLLMRSRGLGFLIAGCWSLGAASLGFSSPTCQDGSLIDGPRPSRIQSDGTALLVDRLPYVVRAVEYQGEPLNLIRELGFNTLWLSQVPTLDLLRRAREQELWVIAPPPTDQGLVPIDWQYDSVLAWLVGQEVTGLDQGAVRERIEAIRQVDSRAGRPVLVQARGSLADYARMAELLCVGRPVVGTSFPLNQYSQWIRQRHELTQAYIPLLAEIQTELPANLQEQAALFSGVNPPLALQSAQLRGQVWQAVAGGARGFLFRSRTRLDDETITNPQRRIHLMLINRQIQQVAPWIAAGLVADRLEQVDSRVQVAVLKTSRSRLLLVQQATGRESYTAGVAAESLLTVRDPAAGASDRPYRLTPIGLENATHQRLGGQMAITIENAADWELLVLTQDHLVLRHVEQNSQANQGWTTQQLLIGLAQNSAEWVNRLYSALLQAGRDPASMREQVGRITEMAVATEALAASRDPLAIWSQTIQLQREVARLHDQLVREVRDMLPWPDGSPLAGHPILVPLHWQSLTRLSGTPWSPNALPGGDFEDLGHLTQNGWQHHSAPGLSIRTRVQLHQDAVVEGRRGLLLAAQPEGGLAQRSIESAPVWIVSAPVEVPANHLVRINGYVRIDSPLTGSLDGLQIQESLGGRDLAQRFTQTNGWQPFTIYRVTSEPHTLRLQILLGGYGTAYIDEVTVQVAALPGPGSSPLGPERESLGPGSPSLAPTGSLPLGLQRSEQPTNLPRASPVSQVPTPVPLPPR